MIPADILLLARIFIRAYYERVNEIRVFFYHLSQHEVSILATIVAAICY